MLIPLVWSPRAIRDGYEAWKAGKPSGDIPQDIELTYAMLAGRCKGKRKIVQNDNTEGWQYVYGPCRNLDWSIVEGKMTPACGIHDNKPAMCSGFPYYGRRRAVEMVENGPGENPGTFKGCGYNADPKAGKDIETFGDGLVPLDEEEK